MAGSYSLEALYRIYDDTTGEYIEVREDRDGLGLFEVVAGKTSIVMTRMQALLVVRAMLKITGGERFEEDEDGSSDKTA